MKVDPNFKEQYESEGLGDSFWSYQELEKSLLRDDIGMIVLDDVSGTQGFIVYQYSSDGSELFYIHIFSAYRGKKKAKILMENYINLIRSKGIGKIFLEVRETNIVAQNLYKAYGFSLLNKRKKYYKDGETALVFEKVL